MNTPKLILVSAILGVFVGFPSVLFGQCGSVTPIDGAIQTTKNCPQIARVKSVISHCYDGDGSVAATPSEPLYGSGECSNNRSYTPPNGSSITCDRTLICRPTFEDVFAVIARGNHASMGISLSRSVAWRFSATGVYPTDCSYSGCADGVQNTSIAHCPNMSCETEDPEEDEDEDAEPEGDSGPDSPLVLDFGRVGFRFSSLESGVEFDIDGDGSAEWISWTVPDSEDAFLALDRNRNGVIDDGTELFGDATDQHSSSSPNGFAALSVFDDPASGGNGDGRISDSDAVFFDLWLWIDWSHDGYSDAAEITRLSESNVLWIDLDYRKSRRRDRYGNELRYISRYFDQNSKHRWVTDVFFLGGEN